MPTAKTALFDDTDVRLAAWAKALAHPARLAILRALAERRSCVCGELVDVLPLAQATVSQHLKALKAAGLIQGTVDGPRVCYCLDPDTLRALEAAVGALFADLRAGGTCC